MSRRSWGQSNATKSNVKSCNLGHGKQIRPCCDRNNPMGSSCHYSNNVLNLNGELSSLKKLKMEKEHEAYHTMEDKITTTSSEGHQIGSYPSKSVIRKRLVIKSLPAIKRERGFLEDSINMREAWMIKWFKAPGPSSGDCYRCDANGRNHAGRIDAGKMCLRDYNDVINNAETASKSIANRTRSKTRSNSRPRTKSNSRPRSRSKTNMTRKILHLKTTVKRRSIDSQTRKQRINKVLFNMKEKIKNNRT
jgi:hypothetical protein